MGINITIPLERLKDAQVSRALSQLMLALGDGAVNGAAGSAKKGRGGRKRKAKGDESTRRAPAKKASRRRKRSSGSAKKAQDEMSFREFVDQLPTNSRAFLELLEDKGTLTISDAMKDLGLDKPKSLGGITGSISRWAPVRGVEIPFQATTTKSGERMWRWTRGKR